MNFCANGDNFRFFFVSKALFCVASPAFALAHCVQHVRAREQQNPIHAVSRANCDILWVQLDALYFFDVNLGWPPAAFSSRRRNLDEA